MKVDAVSKRQDAKLSFVPEYLTKGEHRKVFIDWLSGLAGGFVSVSACAPLDLARTRHMILATTNSSEKVSYRGFLHTAQTIVRNEGVRGLYRGYNVTAVSIPLFHSLYFSIFYKMKRLLNEKWIPQTQQLLTNVAAAVVTGFTCDTLTNPLWVIRTRIQSQYLHVGQQHKYKGLVSGLKKIYKEEGIKALYKGLFTSYVGLSHAAILYPLYEHLKTKLRLWKGELNGLDIFATSLISKVTAMVITYPHVVIRTRQQDQRTPINKVPGQEGKATNYGTSMISMIKETIHREGVKGLYSGLRIDLVRVLPANAITFVTFEQVKKYLENNIPVH